jgi:hypothetical protein
MALTQPRGFEYRYAAYLIKARRTDLHQQAGYIDADVLSPNFSFAVTRRTIHIGNSWRFCCAPAPSENVTLPENASDATGVQVVR